MRKRTENKIIGTKAIDMADQKKKGVPRMKDGKILIMGVNDDRFFVSHRIGLAEDGIKQGWEVNLVGKFSGYRGKIEGMGVKCHVLASAPGRVGFPVMFKDVWILRGLYRNYPFGVRHNVGLKMILLGMLASKGLSGSGRVLNAVSGLGRMFSDPSGIRAKMILKCLKWLSKGEERWLFQNREDMGIFLSAGICRGDRAYMAPGSGVDLGRFSPREKVLDDASRKVRVVFSGRILKEKGIGDFLEVAHQLKTELEGKAEFVIYGGMKEKEGIEGLPQRGENDGYLRWEGEVEPTEIGERIREGDIMFYPSYYREGIPKSLLEGMACGLVVVTTDSVGCRETVNEGENGFLVKPHDVEGMVRVLKDLIKDRDVIEKMGKASRRIAEEKFDERIVRRLHMELWESMIGE